MASTINGIFTGIFGIGASLFMVWLIKKEQKKQEVNK